MSSWLRAAALAAMAFACFVPREAKATNPTGQVGGVTTEVCTALVVTAASAYTSGNEVGGVVALANAVQAPQTGILQSLRLTSKSVQTAEFDVTFFSGNPTASTWTDKSTPAIAAGDVPLVQPPIKLTGNYSGLGTHTVYGADGIGRAIKIQGFGYQTLNAVVTVVGTPTFTTTSDLQLCAAILLD